MKRFLTEMGSIFFLTLLLAVNVQAYSAPTTYHYGDHAAEGNKLRFGVASDVHIGVNSDAETKLHSAYKQFYAASGNQLNAVVFSGDFVNSGTAANYNRFMQITREETRPGTQNIICIGNHEMYSSSVALFTQKTGQEVNTVQKINGITVIKIGGNYVAGDKIDYSVCYNFLEKALREANASDPTAPIFLIAHFGVKGTVYGNTTAWSGIFGKCEQLFAQYPQIILINGHTHMPTQHPGSIDQSAGFTSINAGTEGCNLWAEQQYTNPDTGENSYILNNGLEESEGLMVNVNDRNVVTIYRMNLAGGYYDYEQEPWVIDVPNLVQTRAFTYTKNRTGAAPVFDKDAKVRVSGWSSSSLTVSFTPAKPAHAEQNNDMIEVYQITLTNPNNQQKVVRNFYADYYATKRRDPWHAIITGISTNVSWQISVEAITAFGNKSEPISNAEHAVQPIIKLDYSEGNVADACGHALSQVGSPQPVSGAVSGSTKKAVYFNGQSGYGYMLGTEDFSRILDSFTEEAYFCMERNTGSDQSIFSNQDSSGTGFSTINGTLEFWCYLTSGKIILRAPAPAGKWMHAAATYDGKALRLYVDGKEAASAAAAGYVIHPSERCFFTGADVLHGTSAHCYMKGWVNCASLYSGARTAEEIRQDAADAMATVLVGDLNQDGKISVKDAMLLCKIVRGMLSPNGYETTGDLNGDGKISVKDAVLLIGIVRQAA